MGVQKILITGANGQLGTVISHAIGSKYGQETVVTSDIRESNNQHFTHELLDATDADALEHIIKKHGITQIYHLAAILSPKGEDDPYTAWSINSNSLLAVLKIASKHHLDKVFFPSSIAVFGHDAQKHNTPQNSHRNPSTVYGISKAAGENWANYFFLKHGLDIRSLRYPGIIGHQSLPGGGTTDYAVSIYHNAVLGQPFECYLEKDTALPMIYMEDAVRATLELMEAPKNQISVRTSYNLQAISFTPQEIAASISKIYPDFKISFKPDFRQKIAENWPASLCDNAARKDWGWAPRYSLDDITDDMMSQLNQQYSNKTPQPCI